MRDVPKVHLTKEQVAKLTQDSMDSSLESALTTIEGAMLVIDYYAETNDIPRARFGFISKIGQAKGLLEMAKAEVNEEPLSTY